MKSGLSEIEIGQSQVAHRLISEKLREQILKGEIPAGQELPSTSELAALWKTSKSTAHTALNNLVKEGLLERNHGSATYVCELPLSLSRVGIYYDSPQVWIDDERVFYRSLQGLLEEKLGKLGIEVSVFVDRRPENRQQEVLPELQSAVTLRKIQGLILPLYNGANLPALLKLPVPLSIFSGKSRMVNSVGFDSKNYFDGVMSRLAAEGCKSVALISSIHERLADPRESHQNFSTAEFLQEAKRHRLQTRKSWTRISPTYVWKRAEFGYREFHKLWSQPERLDAVVVYPDMAVRGVITAALELGVHQKDHVVFCFHRNAHVEILCPLRAMWVTSDEGKLADALIRQIRLRHEGKATSVIRLDFDFRSRQRLGIHSA